MITQAQKTLFEKRGLILLESFLPGEKVTSAREVLLGALERKGIWQDGDWQLEDLPQSTATDAGAKLTKDSKRSKVFQELMTQELVDTIEELSGCQPVQPLADHPGVLFTLPNASRWSVPGTIWHLDIPRLPSGRPPGIQMFTFLNTVNPGGGGTLVVTGSHRLLNDRGFIRSRQLKRHLKREPYFRDLMSKNLPDRHRFVEQPGRVGDVELQVVELHGGPGDVYLMDMRILHTLAPNASCVPRMMLTQRFVCDSVREELFNVFGDNESAERSVQGVSVQSDAFDPEF